MPIPVISFVGRSNSGKTTFITQLIPHFINRGFKVGSIKHTHHQVQFDTPGKDSWRHCEAGSSQVVLLTDSQMALFAERPAKQTLQEIADRHFSDFDLVISEGFKKEKCLKIEIYRAANQKPPLFSDPEFNIDLVITDDEVPISSLRFDQLDEACNWVCEKLSLH